MRNGRYDFSIFLIDAIKFVGGDEKRGECAGRRRREGGVEDVSKS